MANARGSDGRSLPASGGPAAVSSAVSPASGEAVPHIVFGQEAHLLEALCCVCCGRDKPFPQTVQRLDHGYAVDVGERAARDLVHEIAARRRWPVQDLLLVPAAESRLRLRSLVTQCLRPADPQSLRTLDAHFPVNTPSAGAFGDGTLAGAGTDDLDSADRADIEYLLGARDREEAQRVLDGLAAVRAAGVSVYRLTNQGPPTSAFPYHILWRLRLRHPELAAFEMAHRVWWGPHTSGRLRVYFEWPREIPPEIPLAGHCLANVDWGVEEGIVLAGRGRVLLARPPAGAAVLAAQPLENAIRLTVAEASVTEASVTEVSAHGAGEAPSGGAAAVFTVEVRLVPENPADTLKRRMADLREEIGVKKGLLESLEARSGAARASGIRAEPLFVYLDRDGRLPARVEDLLVEWSDQDTDLALLRYAKLAPDAFPMYARARPRAVHLLTTVDAVHRCGGSSGAGVGARLRPYAPTHGGIVSFDLMPEWSTFGLRLFAPHDHGFALYPELVPSAAAAEKLAAALLGGAKEDWGALLFPGDGDGLRVVRLPLKAFAPLFAAHEWQCTFDTEVKTADAAPRVAAGVRDGVLRAVEASLGEALTIEADRRLDAVRDAQQQRVQRIAREYEALTAQVTQFTKEARTYSRRVRALEGAMAALRADDPHVRRSLAELRERVRRANGLLQRADRAAGETDRVRGDIAKLARWFPSVRNGGRPRSAAGPPGASDESGAGARASAGPRGRR